MTQANTADVLIIGGGVIGLATAWRTAQRGMTVILADPDPGHGASHAAAGMLTPVAEAAYADAQCWTAADTAASYADLYARLGVR